MQWAYIVRNRRRWSSRESVVTEQAGRAQQLLKDQFGLGTDVLWEVSKSRIAQVVVPFTAEAGGWEERVFPWEYVLTAATRQFRRGGTLTIVRQLHIEQAVALPDKKPTSILYVQSSPYGLEEEYSFDTEFALLQAAAGLVGLAWHDIKNPTLKELEQSIRRLRPDIVHLTGFDTHQGLSLLETRKSAGSAQPARPPFDLPTDRTDGFLLADESGSVYPVDASTLAKVIGPAHPSLVTCNLWNSGTRIAPMLVAGGAAAAIGIQDSLEDELAETFFGRLYRRWCDDAWDLTGAFDAAWTDIREQGQVPLGSGIALWTRACLTIPEQRDKAVAARLRKKRGTQSINVLDPAKDDASNAVGIIVEVAAELNYSLLHNNRPLFESFTLVKRKDGLVRDVQIVVDLHAGERSFPYRRRLELSVDRLDLKNTIHAPLTAELLRSVRESVHSSLFVEVCWGSTVLYRNTHRVRLLPADQWCDSDQDRIWLPCFVLPRDSAITALVEKAQRYVRILRDDPSAGFDGYQSIDEAREDPTEDVDTQVQALWSAILYDWQLSYVPPPPTHSKGLDSQRLRTPSTVLASRSGTCIDLALLLASCLELIGIHPVIFLLTGHAFPGYWRSEDARDEFLKMQEARIEPAADPSGTIVAGTDAEAWIWSSLAYEDIVRQIDQGRLVPIETVRLTEHGGYWEAIDAGRNNLRSRKEFHSMVDVETARTERVTPLPFTTEEHV